MDEIVVLPSLENRVDTRTPPSNLATRDMSLLEESNVSKSTVAFVSLSDGHDGDNREASHIWNCTIALSRVSLSGDVREQTTAHIFILQHDRFHSVPLVRGALLSRRLTPAYLRL